MQGDLCTVRRDQGPSRKTYLQVRKVAEIRRMDLLATRSFGSRAFEKMI